MHDAALILEGGALRTMYTAGVLDVFLENGLEFSMVIGVSAGSLTGLNYVAGQAGRTAHVNINYAEDPEYISPRNRFRHGSVFNLDFLFGDPQGRWEPFNEDAYRNSATRFLVVATSCLSGKPVYFANPQGEELRACLKASCAIPVLSDIVETVAGPCLDGGLSDSLPFAKALEQGWRKLVVVKTRDAGYRKKPNPAALRLLLRKMYGEYPDLVETMAARPEMYNGQLDELRGLEREGRAFVIEPQEPVDIGRTETNPEKLRLLYEAARAQTRGLLPGLREFLA